MSSLRTITFGQSIGIATVAIAAAAIVKTLRSLDHQTNENKSKSSSSCCSVSSSSSQYVTLGSDPTSNPYETQRSVNEYLMMHFGESSQLLNFPKLQLDSILLNESIQFPKKCAEICSKYAQRIRDELNRNQPGSSSSSSPSSQSIALTALDVGCSVGRSSFELTRFVDQVTGLDYSQAFIDTANKLKQGGSLTYTMRTEGDLTESAVARVSPDIDRSRVTFIQGDACNLGTSFSYSQQFSLILAANLLCRLPSPRRFLESLPHLVASNGYVIMPSPYTWLEEYTPKSEWIGGYEDKSTGKPVKSFDRLRELMTSSGYFTFEESFDLPFFIRETYRKNQWSVSHVTIWKRTEKLVAQQ